ncbi:MAG: hypothetical protein QXQ14_00565 [Candidatus Aenigmatarchaeota archaeon]
MVIKEEGIEFEANPIIRKFFEFFGAETGSLVAFTFASIGGIVTSRGLEKAMSYIFKKYKIKINITPYFSNSLLLDLSISKFIVSLSNINFYLNNSAFPELAILAIPFTISPYLLFKIYKQLK